MGGVGDERGMATDEILDLMVLDIFPDASSREPAPKRPKVMSSLTASTLTASAPGELSSLSAAAPSPATSTVTLEDPILNQMTPVVFGLEQLANLGAPESNRTRTWSLSNVKLKFDV